MADLTPMMKQYAEIKERHADCVLMFRLGDFYEMFFEDAKTASRELELVLTGRDCGQDERAPMCGVPYHSADGYIARLVQKGYKVAVCEQLENPALASGIVKRDVVRIITPGTVIEGSMLDEGRNNYLGVLYLEEDCTKAGLCFLDTSTGEAHATVLTGEDIAGRICNELGRYTPSEMLCNAAAMRHSEVEEFLRLRLSVRATLAQDLHFDYDECAARIIAQFGADELSDLRLEDGFCAVRALGCALDYLSETQRTGIHRINRLDVYTDTQYMKLDYTAKRNLEICETMRSKEKRGSLLGVIDKTNTAMGKRMLRSWLEQPLVNPTQILRRQEAVAALFEDNILRGDLAGMLKRVVDLERIMTRVVYGSANARELLTLAYALPELGHIKQRLEGATAPLLVEIYNRLDPMDDTYARVTAALVDNPPLSVREGGLIRRGYDAGLDALVADMADGKGTIARIEATEKEAAGIKSLKVGYNRVFGYYIELPRSAAASVPDHYIRKQTLANCERYITEELKQLEGRVLGAKEQAAALEYQLFEELRGAVAAQLGRIGQSSAAAAKLDVVVSLAEVAAEHRYCRPFVDLKGRISIKDGRHPVVEAVMDAPFVPNDTLLDNDLHAVALITGPNMAGKSTYMRQTALIVLLAQIGSFVPAASAEIGIVDAIFTRVGASDDLAAGQSTFMVEMSEVAAILKNATRNSLVIFDEIGRGTSTFDGMSIARAVLEYAANPKKMGAKTMFATHYHELTVMEQEIDNIKNYHIAVKKRGDDITFLRRILPGPADDSYGIEVAKLAGVPAAVVTRARAVLAQLEASEGTQGKSTQTPAPADQLTFGADNEITAKLKGIDVNTLTPLEALQMLYELCKLAQ